jgi:hypothetical protein
MIQINFPPFGAKSVHPSVNLPATLYNNHVPKPLHLQSKRAQALTLKGMRDAEAEAITLAVSKNIAVRELLSQGYGKVFIIEKVWHAKAGATQRYKQACAEYEQIISEVEEA